MRFFVLALTVLALGLMALVPAQAQAQTPVPTDTPTSSPTLTATPDTWESHTLESGHNFIVMREATYGEIFVGLGTFLVAGVLVLRWLYDFAVRWLH